jgi:PleD family two-component response regulator
MNRILLADDSPHAQRMGERILREEGFEVVTVTDGETALIRLGDVDPDLVLADVFLPKKSGYEICQFVKSQPRHRYVRVVLTAGMLEPFDEEEARRVGSDAILKKPFEASVVMDTIRPLIQSAHFARGLFAETAPALEATQTAAASSTAPAALAAEIDPERIRAAITLALDAALPTMIEEITERVLVALGH